MYDEDALPPYYVDGPGSAHVNMVSAVSLLFTYCNSFVSDAYTSYVPNWYLDRMELGASVIIEMPTVCPYIKPIKVIKLNYLYVFINIVSSRALVCATKDRQNVQLL